MLEVESTDQHGLTANSAASEAFPRRLHHQNASVKLPSAGGISFCHVMPYFVRLH